MNEDSTLNTIVLLIRQTLFLPEDQPVVCGQLLFYDLHFTSMDFADLLFRIEEHFKISIPEGTLYRLAQGDMDEATFADYQVLTESGRRQLMKLLHDSPPEIFPEVVHTSTLYRYCTVGALVRLVQHEVEEQLSV